MPNLGEMKGQWPGMWAENAQAAFEQISASLRLKGMCKIAQANLGIPSLGFVPTMRADRSMLS